jgi:hypothetical protein
MSQPFDTFKTMYPQTVKMMELQDKAEVVFDFLNWVGNQEIDTELWNRIMERDKDKHRAVWKFFGVDILEVELERARVIEKHEKAIALEVAKQKGEVS